jgi:lipopolysaccharide/colanic/teichoic acid biosynthesis glycosyltransferase
MARGWISRERALARFWQLGCERRASGVSGRHPWYARTKTAVESAIALVLLALASPLILVLAALVKLTSRGPALYSQVRVGVGGQSYRIYKLRTMRHNCEVATGPQWSTGEDPRITPIGRFLRRTHLDELPQLWNVVRGEMGLVGPRPERPEFVEKLEKEIPGYRGRLQVRPGITGLAQVHLPADSDIDSVRRKLMYDLHYLRRFSLLLDIKLMLCTALYLVGVPFERSCRWLNVPRAQAIEAETYRGVHMSAAIVPIPVEPPARPYTGRRPILPDWATAHHG